MQIYTAAVEEALGYGEVNRGQFALLDRLRESLNISQDDARSMEQRLQFDRNAVAG